MSQPLEAHHGALRAAKSGKFAAFLVRWLKKHDTQDDRQQTEL
jgi:hypothetical protein